MTNKLPFPELVSAGAITVMVVQGNVPRTREDTQLSQLIGLCSIMTDSWSFNPRNRPSIEKCLNDVKWMVRKLYTSFNTNVLNTFTVSRQWPH